MHSLVIEISNRKQFQQQALFYFCNKKNVVFLNSNDDGENLLAISDKDDVIDKEWKFGFFSYDYKNKIEKLTSNNFDGICFADKHFFSPEILFKIGLSKVTVFYNTLIYSLELINQLVEDICTVSIKKYKNEKICLRSRITKKQYIENVISLKDHIQKGDIYEINYCQEFYAKNINIDPITAYFKLNSVSPTPFSCFVKANNKYLLSASPERFVKKEKDRILSQPIKGTARRGKTDSEDISLKQQLKKDQKEISENVMIVDLVRNDLSRIASKGSVIVDELCEVYTFPQVHQMISTVSANVDEKTPIDAVMNAMFPMGSMTGAPKIRAMELIEKYEQTKRGLYSGTVGFIDPVNDFDFNVVIRSILYNKEKKYLSFSVGGAITSLSDPRKEYEECLLKAEAMFQVLDA